MNAKALPTICTGGLLIMDTAVEEDTEEERKMPLAIMQGYMTIVQVWLFSIASVPENLESSRCVIYYQLSLSSLTFMVLYHDLKCPSLTVFNQEFMDQCEDETPSHVFLQVSSMINIVTKVQQIQNQYQIEYCIIKLSVSSPRPTTP